MGLFLMMSGVAQSDQSQVETALRDFAEQQSATLLPLVDGESADEKELLVIAESAQGNVTVTYPPWFTGGDTASQYLSATLGKPVFSLHMHDGDLWMYTLYAGGQDVDRFNPIPDYWEELAEEEQESWSGDASVVSRYWPNVSQAQIANYLVCWELDDETKSGAKAYPEDEYGTGEDWQMMDFMAKVGLVYPFDEQGSPLGTVYRFQGRVQASLPQVTPRQQREPFWRRWFK